MPTSPSGANPPTTTTLAPRGMLKCCGYTGAFLVAVTILVLAIIYSKIKLPHFQLDRVSVDHSDNTTAVWDVGFSIDRSVGDTLDVWFRFMSRDYTVESVGSAGNATVSVSTSAAGFDNFSSELITIEQLTFRCRNYRNHIVEAACKDVAVVGGAIKGGPRLCPVVLEEGI